MCAQGGGRGAQAVYFLPGPLLRLPMVPSLCLQSGVEGRAFAAGCEAETSSDEILNNGDPIRELREKSAGPSLASLVSQLV